MIYHTTYKSFRSFYSIFFSYKFINSKPDSNRIMQRLSTTFLYSRRCRFRHTLLLLPSVRSHLLQIISFREFARFFRETSRFRDIGMFCFREIMLPLKYAIQTIAVSEDWNLLFSGDWNMSFSGNYNILILERLKCAIFGRLKYVIFGTLLYFNYREIEMSHLFGDWNVSFSGDWNVLFLENYNTSIIGRLKCAISLFLCRNK